VKGTIPEGTLGEIVFGTAFGKVNAHIKFLYEGVDGVPLAQAFAFLAMNARSSQRFKRALERNAYPGPCRETNTDRHGLRHAAPKRSPALRNAQFNATSEIERLRI
jgi:hypothetical protein